MQEDTSDGQDGPSWPWKSIKPLHIPTNLGKEEVSACNYLSPLFQRGSGTQIVYGTVSIFFILKEET